MCEPKEFINCNGKGEYWVVRKFRETQIHMTFFLGLKDLAQVGMEQTC